MKKIILGLTLLISASSFAYNPYNYTGEETPEETNKLAQKYAKAAAKHCTSKFLTYVENKYDVVSNLDILSEEERGSSVIRDFLESDLKEDEESGVLFNLESKFEYWGMGPYSSVWIHFIHKDKNGELLFHKAKVGTYQKRWPFNQCFINPGYPQYQNIHLIND